MILIVDDKQENIFSLERTLQIKGFQTDSALSGEEALKKCIKMDYALIILDVQMPDMDGYEVAETLSGIKKTKDIPIIFLSAVNREKQYITKGYESGGIDYITKPVDPDILLLKVKTFYRLYEQTSELKRMQDDLRKEIQYRKRTQNELSDRLGELKVTLEALPQLAFTTDSQGNIDFVNEQWFRFSPDKSRWPSLHPKDQAVFEDWKLNLESLQPLEKEVRILEINSQSYRYHLLKIVPVSQQGDGTRWVGIMTDIDERKQLEKKKDEFLSVASHELKTPLTSIMAFSKIALRAMKDLADHRAYGYVRKVQDQSEKLNSLVQDLLDISRMETGGLKVNLQQVDLDDVIHQVTESTLMANPHRRLQIERTGDPIANPVLADPLRIEQVLSNYLSNAVKYSPDSELVGINTSFGENFLTVEVRDYGIGIPEHKIPYVFDKFYRVQEASARFQGLGLGLHICKEIIVQHGGTCGVKSQVGEGSTFYFTLPIHR
ncbi:ATP-binding response regulator [Sphingobacterium daejeonense]|uniref:ATP-binding response regulator n=1 Tax=Sphingobacterium daejeonense TaxID=371142 RepID=UPI0010C41FCB|nr:ATP-binding protein [Sphingobacterium daejeonense]VTQ07578.1 Alkaline phosphatase synthesis sensor protein phoR [Sphingobacterium daejeonense]